MHLPRICFLFLFALLALPSLESNAQADRLIKKANDLYELKFYRQAIPIYREALISENNLEAKLNLAHAYRMTGNTERAEYWYELLVPQTPYQRENEFYYAQVLQSNEKYSEAAEWYRKYALFDERAEAYAKACDNHMQFRGNAQKYDVSPVPINTPSSEFGVAYYQDGLVFTSNRVSNKNTEKVTYAFDQDPLNLYFTKELLGNSYTPPKKLSGNINSAANEGPCSFGFRESEIWFTRNDIGKIKNGQLVASGNTLSIRSARLEKGKWLENKPFPHNRATHSTAHPSITYDGQTLFFVSDRPGGYGGTDIYMCHRMDTTWSAPINLGEVVNSPENEMFPFVHRDGTLFFTSSGHPGMGGYDFFKTRRENGKWKVPENLGAPLNSPKDEFTIVLNKTKTEGYLASNRKGSIGEDDLYFFRLLYGSEKTDPANQALSFKAEDEMNPGNGNTSTETLVMAGEGDMLNGPLNMNAVDFDFKQSHLTFTASNEIDKVVEHLKMYPLKTIAVEVHTDSQGDDNFNLSLSDVRAKNIRDYIVSKGINIGKIEAIGYGEKFILNECKNGIACDESMHKLNRRVIFRVTTPNIIPQGSPPPTTQVTEPNTSFQEVAEAPQEEFIDFKSNQTQPEVIQPTPNREKKPKQEKVKKVKTPKTKDNVKVKKPREPKQPKVKNTPNPNINTATPKPGSSSKEAKVPLVMTTSDPSGLKYSVILGPYQAITGEMRHDLEKLEVQLDFTSDEQGEWAKIGYFNTIYEAEQTSNYLKKCQLKNNVIIVYADGNRTSYTIKQLKKEGLK